MGADNAGLISSSREHDGQHVAQRCAGRQTRSAGGGWAMLDVGARRQQRQPLQRAITPDKGFDKRVRRVREDALRRVVLNDLAGAQDGDCLLYTSPSPRD